MNALNVDPDEDGFVQVKTKPHKKGKKVQL